MPHVQKNFWLLPCKMVLLHSSSSSSQRTVSSSSPPLHHYITIQVNLKKSLCQSLLFRLPSFFAHRFLCYGIKDTDCKRTEEPLLMKPLKMKSETVNSAFLLSSRRLHLYALQLCSHHHSWCFSLDLRHLPHRCTLSLSFLSFAFNSSESQKARKPFVCPRCCFVMSLTWRNLTNDVSFLKFEELSCLTCPSFRIDSLFEFVFMILIVLLRGIWLRILDSRDFKLMSRKIASLS